MNLEKNKTQKGFTIVELMISTVIFSLVMLLCLTGMVQVSRAYYKGVTQSRTQEAARLVMDEISQNLKLSGSSVVSLPSTNSGPQVNINRLEEGIGVFCAGNKKYTYALDRKVVSSNSNEDQKEIRNALVSEDAVCTDLMSTDIEVLNNQISSNRKSLLSENMRLTRFSITEYNPDVSVPIKSNSQIWRIEISIAYGDQDLFSVNGSGRYVDDSNNERVVCKSSTGTEFCATVEMSIIVSRRIS
jgi:prepilin-type N-terminal cleavage/methylation domain-containing protein